jgi:hypothetical protein
LVCKNVMVNGKRFDVPDEFKLVATDKMATP